MIYLSADAYGVLPPVSIWMKTGSIPLLVQLIPNWPVRNGVLQNRCLLLGSLGAAFLTVHPTIYQNLVKNEEHGAKAYLVNTGWNGTGKRISLKETRAIIDAILDGSIDRLRQTHPHYEPEYSVELPNVSSDILIRAVHMPIKGMGRKAISLAGKYIKNFEKYCDNDDACAWSRQAHNS